MLGIFVWSEVRKLRSCNSRLLDSIDNEINSSNIAEIFATKYMDLHSGVPCSSGELDCIKSYVDTHIDRASFYDCVVDAKEVYKVMHLLKANNSEGVCGLSSDFFFYIFQPQRMCALEQRIIEVLPDQKWG
jgi:hypothetical protein